MASKNLQEISSDASEISQFYTGKTILITGAAGYLGTLMLEILLKWCPGIKKIFILLRPKNGSKPEDRKAEIFRKEIFDKLKEDNPDALNKVIAIPGDIIEENLGMSDNDLQKVTEEVSIVFHCAASISFFKRLSFLMKHNVIGTDNVINFCQKLTKLEVLVYSSTLYSNTNRTGDIEEKIYKLPFKAEEAVELTRKCDDDGLDRLFSSLDLKFLNFYTFTKCVSENLLGEKAHDLPLCIVRPGLISSCTKGSLPGYVEDGSILVTLSTGLGKGVIRVGRSFENVEYEFVTGDVAANTHIVAAYLHVTKGLTSPSIYNCTPGKLRKWNDIVTSMLNMVIKYPLPNAYLIPSFVFCKSEMTFYLYSFIYHYLPAFLIDIFLWMSGSHFRLIKTYKFYERIVEKTEPFIRGNWNFRNENFKSLPEKLNATDAEIFCVDMKDFTFENLTLSLRSGCKHYRVGNKPYEVNLRSLLLRYFLTYLIKFCVIGLFASIFYMVLF